MKALHDVEAVILAVSWLISLIVAGMAGYIAATKAHLEAKQQLFMAGKSAIEKLYNDWRKKDDVRNLPTSSAAGSGCSTDGTGEPSAGSTAKKEEAAESVSVLRSGRPRRLRLSKARRKKVEKLLVGNGLIDSITPSCDGQPIDTITRPREGRRGKKKGNEGAGQKRRGNTLEEKATGEGK